MIIGIDPGARGAVAFIRKGHVGVQSLAYTDAGAVNVPALYDEVCAPSWHNLHIVVERQSYRPGQGGVNTLMANYGRILAVCEMAEQGAKITEAMPTTWKRAVLGDRYTHDKAGTILWAQDTYPNVSLIPPGGRVPHDGYADALAIAYYGKMQYES